MLRPQAPRPGWNSYLIEEWVGWSGRIAWDWTSFSYGAKKSNNLNIKIVKPVLQVIMNQQRASRKIHNCHQKGSIRLPNRMKLRKSSKTGGWVQNLLFIEDIVDAQSQCVPKTLPEAQRTQKLSP